MRIRHFIFGLLSLLVLAACSSGGNDDSFSVPPVTVIDPTDPITVPVEIASIDALTSNPQLQSDGGIPVTITALVKDTNNIFVEGAIVTFSTDSGGLLVVNDTTGVDGVAMATLSTQGDPTNRTINVSATSGGFSDTVTVTVIGTSVQITGPASLAQGASGTYTFVLNNANGQGIEGETIAVSSALGNTLSAQTLTTDSAGQAQVTYTAVNGGTDTLLASALGESSVSMIEVSDDSFAFISPAPGTEIDLGTSQNITLQWSQDGNPVSGQPVSFASTRGTVVPASVVTNGSGQATVAISAANAGIGTISASTDGGPTATLEVEFVATLPDSIEVQANPFTVAPNSQASITAIVRDVNDNLVKNVEVRFDLDDITTGQLAVPSAVTDSQGRAQTFYTSSSQTSPQDGVAITATVATDATITDTVNLTVAGREVFFNFGTGNEIIESTPAQYQRPYVVQVTDADGRPVGNVEVTMSVVSVEYIKGYWCYSDDANQWVPVVQENCADEDVNRDGIQDPGEDTNNNGRIEAGNIATIIPGAFTTDANGFGFIDLYYPQDHGNFLVVELQARAAVQGTEFTEQSVFLLGTAGEDTATENIPPPGLLTVPDGFTPNPNPDLCQVAATDGTAILSSPFGYNPNCTVWDFPNL